MRINIRGMAQQFDEIYESWMSNLAAGAIATVALAGTPMGRSMASPVPNPNTMALANVAQQVNVAVPKDRPKSFKDFRDKYMYAIYYTKIPNHPMLSSAAETFAGPRFNMLLSSFVKLHETNGKYTPKGVKENYVTHNGVKYAQRVADPSGGYSIGDGLSLNAESKFPALVAPYLHNRVAFDKVWNPIISTARIKERIEYLEAKTADAVGTAFFNQSRKELIKFLAKKGVNYNNLDAYAKLALEDLAYNQGGNISYKSMLDALSGEVPDYVRAAYEMCNCKDWDSFGGLRQRRIHDAHLLLMAADRNGGLDIYRGILGKTAPAQTPAGEQHDVVDTKDMVSYAVSKGDSLWTIAKKFHSTVDEIAADNNLDPVAALPVGKILRVRPVKTDNMDAVQRGALMKPAKPSPTAKWHTVRPGETFSGIAFKNKVRLEKLKSLNPAINYDRIKPGQKVRVS